MSIRARSTRRNAPTSAFFTRKALFAATLVMASAIAGLAAFGPQSLSLTRLFAGATAEAKTFREVEPQLHAEPPAPISMPDGTLATARAGHTATLLDDGRVLVVGGSGDTSAELYDPGTGVSVPKFTNQARSGHTATRLSDGRVLIAGGGTSEFYNPAEDTFSPGPDMIASRSGHTATAVSGSVIITGGGNNSVEIYDSTNNSFTSAGSLTESRTNHSAVAMNDGRVFIAGGTGSATAEIYNPADGTSVATGNPLAHERSKAHLRVLPDGKVQIIGGNSDVSMEVYDPAIDTIGAHVHLLPDTDTCTGLRSGVRDSQSRAALFFADNADAAYDRTGHTITEVSGNQALVIGGTTGGTATNSVTTFASSPATITTDKLDYAPGETVTFSGTGFAPNETVRVVIHEDPHTHLERNFEAVADASGNITGSYLVEEHDLNVKFIVNARGLTSNLTAQTAFTDARTIETVSVTFGTSTVSCPGANCTVTPIPVPASASLELSITVDGTGAASNQRAWESTGWAITTSSTPPTSFSGANCIDHTDYDGGEHSEDFIVTGPSGAGTYYAHFRAFRNDTCGNQTGANSPSDYVTITSSITVDATPPVVTNVSSPTANGTYGIGSVIPVQITFSENLTVTGTPQLTLETGTTDAIVNYSGGSGTNTLTFNYTVAAGHTSSDLNYVGTGSLALNGGTIKDAATNNATLTLPGLAAAGSLGTNKSIVIDGVVPTVTSINRATAETTNASSVSWSVTFSENVTGVDATDFELVNSGLTGTPNITGVTGSGSSYTVTADTGNGSGTLGLNLVDDNSIQDAATNPLGGSVAGDGNFTGQTYTLDRTLSPAITAANKVYDGDITATILTRTFTSALAVTEDVQVTGGTATFDTKHVGTGKTVTATGLTLGGTAAPRYVLSSTTATTTANITVRATIVTALADTKVYDGNANSTATPTISPAIASSDTATFTQSFDNKHVGTGKTLIPAGSVADGNGGNNYAITFVNNTTGVITAKAITVTAVADSKVYDGGTVSTGTPTIVPALVGGDTSNFVQTFDTKHVGTGKTLTVSGSVSDGNSGNNYSVTLATNTAGVVTAKPITVTAVADNRTYNGTTSSAGAPLIAPALVGGDTSNFVQTFDTKHVGTGKTLTPSGTANDGNGGNNYAVTFANSTAGEITQLAITVTAVTDSREYDGTMNSAGTPTIAPPLVGGDTSGFTQSFDTKHAGTGKTLTPAGAAVDGNSGNNYAVTFAAVNTGVITQRAITVTAVADTRVYDGTTGSTGVPTVGAPGIASGDTPNFTQAFDTKHVGTLKTLTPAGSVTDGNGGLNYDVTFTPASTGEITKLSITVTAAADSREYDGTTASAAIPTGAPAVASGDTPNFTQSFDTKHVGTGKILTPAGTVSDGNSGNNYDITFTPANTGTVTARELTVVAVTDTKVYDTTTSSDETPQIAVGSLASGDTASFSQVFDTPNAGTGKLLIPSGTITDGNSGNNYDVTFLNDNTGVINKADAVCTISGTTVTYDGNDHGASGSCVGVQAEVLAGLDLGATFTNVPGGTANWTFTDVTGNYNNDSGTASIVINKADAVCTISGTTVTYDGNAHGASGSCVGVQAEVLAGLDLGATFTNVPGGTANWTFTDVTGNYNDNSGSVQIDITKANAVVVVTPYDVVYDGQPHTAAVTSITGVNGETGAIVGTVDVSGTTHTDAGTYNDTWSFTGTNNYNDQLNVPILNQIDQAQVTATGGSGFGIYSGLAQSPSPCVVSGPYTGDLGCVNDPTTVGPDVGTFPIAPITSGPDIANFIVNAVNGSYKIDPASPTLTLSLPGGNLVTYNGLPHPATFTVTGVSGPLSDPADGTIVVNYNGDPTVPVSVGVYSVVGTFTSTNPNYTSGSTIASTLTIQQAPLTVTASSHNVVFGEAVPSITPSYDGFVNSEGPGVLDTAPTCSTTYTVGSTVDDSPYSTTCTGGVDNNYSFQYVAGSVTVGKASTTTAITSDNNDPSVVGESVVVTWTVTVDAPGTGTPTGTVNVTATDSMGCSAAVEDGQCTLVFTASGSKTITATYSGDSNLEEGDDTEGHDVDQADTTTTIISDSPDPSVTGQSITVAFGVTVNAPGAGSPTGSVTVTANTGESCGGTIAGGSCNITFITAGPRTLTAEYAGDTNFNGSTSVGEPHQVDKADTSTTITSDLPDPSVVGQAYAVNWTFSVVAPGAGSPTGNITVSDGTDSCTAAASAGTCNLTSSTFGPKTLTATYGGDSNFNGSSDTEAHQVNKRSTSTTVSCVPSAVFLNGTSTCTATVTDTDVPTASTPTGTVAFATNSTGAFSPVTASCSLVGVNSTTASCTIDYAANAVLAHTITGTYNGDAAHMGSFGTGSISVTYNFFGFFSPVDNLPAINQVQAGRAIPLKWTIKDAFGIPVLSLSTVTGITYYQIPCASETIVNPIEGLADDAGFSELRLTSDGYHFNWKTEKSFANKCFEIRVTLLDTSVHKAKFKFKK